MSWTTLDDGDADSRGAALDCFSEIESSRTPKEIFECADQYVVKALRLTRKARRLENLATVMQKFAIGSRELVQTSLDKLLSEYKDILPDFKSIPGNSHLLDKITILAEDGDATLEMLEDIHLRLMEYDSASNTGCKKMSDWITTFKHKFDMLLSTLAEDLQSTHPLTSRDAATRFNYHTNDELAAPTDPSAEQKDRESKYETQRTPKTSSKIDHELAEEIIAAIPDDMVSPKQGSPILDTEVHRQHLMGLKASKRQRSRLRKHRQKHQKFDNPIEVKQESVTETDIDARPHKKRKTGSRDAHGLRFP